jgi:epoxyqueuosine reductase
MQQDIEPLLVEKAKSLGFLAVGFTRPGRPLRFDSFSVWLKDGKNADMAWLARNLDVREDPSRMLRNCSTVISLAYPYSANKPKTLDGFSIARYANPAIEDYHIRLRTICGELVSMIRDKIPESRSRICVDSAPLMERSIAAAAGIGFVGKNNLLIIPGYGSYFYLAEILTTAAFSRLSPEQLDNQCGSCSLCLGACPTGALEKNYSLNAQRCLSYLTVEDKRPLKPDLGGAMGRCFFGCDRCQEVCPFNRKTDDSDVVLPSTDMLLGMGKRLSKGDSGGQPWPEQVSKN